MSLTHLTYEARSHLCRSPMGKKIFTLLDEKKTNLALSADVTSSEQLIELADRLGPEICVLKTHIDIIDDYSPALTKRLRDLATEHQFLIFEDRKFADIGHTVKLQYGGGSYRIVDWADLVNAHCLPGPGTIEGLAEVGLPKGRGLILLAQMSSKGHLMDEAYREHTLKMAEEASDFVVGFITQHAISPNPSWINFAPGIQLKTGSDKLGQQYRTPSNAIFDHHIDVIIVGRGIIQSSNPLDEAKKYRAHGWAAYLQRNGL